MNRNGRRSALVWARATCWPDCRQELLLRAVFGRDDVVLDAWRQWKTSVDLEVEHLDRASYRLLPRLYRRLSAHGVDDPWMGRLKGVTRLAWYKNQRTLRSGSLAVEALQQAGIKTLLINDAALALSSGDGHFPAAMDGVDVLVPSDTAAKAVRVLLESGWQPRILPEEALDNALFRLLPACSFRDHQGQGVRLHWRLPIQAGHAVDGSRVWSQSVPLEIGGIGTRALGASDRVLQACVHGMLPAHIPGTAWVADAMDVLTPDTAQVDWSQIAQVAGELRLSLVMRSALRYLSSVLGVGVPAGHLQDMDAAPASLAERCEFQMFSRPLGAVGNLLRCWLRYRRHVWQPGQSRLWLRDLAGFRGFLGRQEEHRRLRDIASWPAGR